MTEIELSLRALYSGYMESSLLRLFCSYRHIILAALCFLAPQVSGAQAPLASTHTPPSSELFYEGYASYGCFKFAGGETRASIFYGGVEYDRYAHGPHQNKLERYFQSIPYLSAPARLAHARGDYSAEFLPVVILREPTISDKWGNPLSPYQKSVPGMAISPVGLRWMWRDGKAFKPVWSFHMGIVGFTQKALSSTATYANLTISSGEGFQAKLTPRIDMRVEYEFHHFSNAYVNGSNPGLDTLGINFGIVYHLPASSKW